MKMNFALICASSFPIKINTVDTRCPERVIAGTPTKNKQGYKILKTDPISLWEHVHGASSHFPIAMMFVSFAFDLGAIVFRNRNWRTVGFWTLIVAAIIAVPTILSGLTGLYGWFGFEKWDSKTMLLHRNLALFSGGAVILLALWRGLRRDKLGKGEFIAYMIIVTAATAGIGYTGYLGAYVAQGL